MITNCIIKPQIESSKGLWKRQRSSVKTVGNIKLLEVIVISGFALAVRHGNKARQATRGKISNDKTPFSVKGSRTIGSHLWN